MENRFRYDHPVIQDVIPEIQDVPCMRLTPKELVEEANHLHHQSWKLEQQNKALMELVGDITRCIEYCTEEANMSYLHYWREKLKEIGGE